MGHGKLKKFAENETFRCLLQPDASAVLAKEPGSRELKLNDHPIKGNWGAQMFGNSNPIVLELGCGKGDYTIALALRNPNINYIGVDIKGARLWKGAKFATENALPNVAFLRTRIEFIDAFFGPEEVSEIWLTFSDPQLRGSENARLSSPLFLERYRKFLKPNGIVHLKTDSRYLYEYTQSVCQVNHLPVHFQSTDVYKDASCPEVVTQVQTFYEKMFLEMGLPITYMAFGLEHDGPYAFPGEAFDHEKWLEAEGPRRSFSHQPTKRG
jgi:tRNA (guanine-N7-)-methyltransferase